MTEKYEFIDGEAGNYPVRRMCVWAGVSTSGFHQWRSRPLSSTAGRRAELKAIIRQVFSDSHETYGYRRVHAALQRMNVQAGPELIHALMRELGLFPCQPRPWRVTTVADDAAPQTPDLVARDFTADAPGLKLVRGLHRRMLTKLLRDAFGLDCRLIVHPAWSDDSGDQQATLAVALVRGLP
ncbi:IS3 family transposase [Streptantibioticus ferralitis]|uniref:IS3 family transposase n=1 Tax=Streptantibioticus ferralitis TaxID=236510 RepID=A0ABT5ZBH6_9ACTN|nr:IS3 family transposase [Streptantibioticus ferralitis]MDF2261033.1 IS3 family transposase [Streptantibioticus ferralitis]